MANILKKKKNPEHLKIPKRPTKKNPNKSLYFTLNCINVTPDTVEMLDKILAHLVVVVYTKVK